MFASACIYLTYSYSADAAAITFAPIKWAYSRSSAGGEIILNSVSSYLDLIESHIGHRNSLLLNGAKNARNLLYLISLTVFSRAFLSLAGMPVLSSR